MPLHPSGSRSIMLQAESPQPPSNSDLEKCGLTPYRLLPPDWRLPTQVNQPELGYPGLHPTHPGQQEDAITKLLVQVGFGARILVGTESFSAHQMIYKKLNDDTGFNISSAALSALIEARRRYCAINSYDTNSTIKVPGRVTLNDQKRENWLRDLADNSIPLLKLSKNVPHGFKGEKLLEMLVARKIHAVRATWYIRLIGLNEVNAQRNKNDLSHIRYTLAFTCDVCQFLQKQLAEVTVPSQTTLFVSTTNLITTSSRLAGMNVRSKPRSSTLSDPETRKNWVAKWNQSCQLLKRFYFESLLDQPSFFKWLVDQLKVANFAQVNFLLEIHRSMLDRFCLSSNLVRTFVEACLGQIRFIAKQTANSYLSKLEHRLKLAVQSTFIFCPDNFVWPDLWLSNKILLEDIILSNVSLLNTPINPLKQDIKAHQVKEMLKNDFFAINWRVDELVGDAGIGTGVIRNTFTRRAQLVEILDRYTDYSDCSKLYYKYFINPSICGHTVVPFKDKLEVLLSWATTPFRTSDKRVYLTANTLSLVKHDSKKIEDDFQNILIGWLEQIESVEGGDLLVRLFSELSRHNIFSYGAYVQRMVAKGDTECDMLVGKSTGLQILLSEWMPLASSTKLLRERNHYLKRSPGRDTARNVLMATIADMKSAIATGDHEKFIRLLRRPLDVSHPTSSNRKVLAESLPDALIHLITDLSSCDWTVSALSARSASSRPAAMVSALLTWGVQLFELSHTYNKLFDVIHKVVQIDLSRAETIRSCDRTQNEFRNPLQSIYLCLQVVCVAASKNREILEISGQLVDLVSRLFTLYFHFRRLTGVASSVDRGFVRCLRSLVIESNLMDGQILEVLDKENQFVFDESIPGLSTTASPSSRTSEILNLIQFPSIEQASRLVTKFWEEYRSDMDWGPTLWHSLVTAIKISDQGYCTDSSLVKSEEQAQSSLAHWIRIRHAILQFCETVDMLYDEGLRGCIVKTVTINSPHLDDESLLLPLSRTSATKLSSEEREEGEEGEEFSTDNFTSKPALYCNSRSLSPTLRRLLVELASIGLANIDVVLEEYVLRPIADDIPQMLMKLDASSAKEPLITRLKLQQCSQAKQALKQLEEMFELIVEILCEQNAHQYTEVSQSFKESALNLAEPIAIAAPHLPLPHVGSSVTAQINPKELDFAMEEYVRFWRLNVERRLWFEQGDEGIAFCSRLLLSLLISIKTISEAAVNHQSLEERAKEDSYEYVLQKILQILARFNTLLCKDLTLLRRLLPLQAAVFLNPILEFTEKNDFGTNFHANLIQSIDELLPYPLPVDLSNQRYPQLEAIFKDTCIFNHSARTRQFQLHIRLLISSSPPQVAVIKEAPGELNAILFALVEVMARRLHLTDSKDASPFFLTCLPASVAEALIIKLSAYLGMSICRLLGPNQTEPAPEVIRIHHICRCINTLTNQLATRKYQMNDDVTIKVMGGFGQLACNATLESYLSYWHQLKACLTLLSARFHEYSITKPSLGSTRMDLRILRGLLHSIQVVLWSLPGLIQHLGDLKQTIAEMWVDVALRVQGDTAILNQVMDTVGILLFSTPPSESCLTAAVGFFRKRFRWLYQPILNLEDGINVAPINRLKYLLGSSLRGSSNTFQERPKDGTIKFVEEKAWEELEKMDVSGPGFISIDALKCQTLSQVEPIPESTRQLANNCCKSKRTCGEMEDGIMGEDLDEAGEGVEDRFAESYMPGAEAEEEDGPMRGERDSFEHELITDGLSMMPLHFLRSLCPPRSRLLGDDWIVLAERQRRLQIRQAEKAQQQQSEIQPAKDSNQSKKRKVLSATIIPVEVASTQSSSIGPTLRSTRSTRKKSSAPSTTMSLTTSASTAKRAKKR
ncbi:hypothetical protein O181_020137 [Austropuccinia psidii MF-1]|uniref:Mediator of RNA polymerase II transcription subunit 12 n=1 Tax=Austropuccinia psidii MF-1 TaxID=1389203 RepID=A0A9Q3CCX2_9BASI|nr:hypothetical protein [Austropuccinia psidii MF-1]